MKFGLNEKRLPSVGVLLTASVGPDELGLCQYLLPVGDSQSVTMEVSQDEEEESNKKENIEWVEQILRKYLEEYPPQPSSPAPESEDNSEPPPPPPQPSDPSAPVPMEISSPDPPQNGAPQQQQQHQSADTLKMCITEIEMRDEGFDTDIDNEVPTMSRIINARVKYMLEGDEEERLHFWVIKIPTPFLPNRKVAAYANLHRREVSFYVDILPVMKVWVDSQDLDSLLEFHVPNCYYGKVNRPLDVEPDSDIIEHVLHAEFVLVLQDMRAFEYGKRHFGEGMSTAEALAAVTEITKFHAVSYAMQKKEGMTFEFPELFSAEELVKLYTPLFKKGAKTFENFMSNYTSEVITNEEKALMCKVVKQLEGNIGEVLAELFKPSETLPSTLVHMDLWSDNLLFRIKDEDRESNVPPDQFDLDCVIIDWQMASCGNPTHDLALLMLGSMDSSVRQASAHDLLVYYIQYFAKILDLFELPMPFTFESLMSNFQSSCVLAVVMAISSMDLIVQEEGAQNRLLLTLKDLFDDGILPVYPNSQANLPVQAQASYIS